MSEGQYLYEDWLCEHAACDVEPCEACKGTRSVRDSNGIMRFLYGAQDLSLMIRALKIYRQYLEEYEPNALDFKLKEIDDLVAQLISPGQ